MKSKMLLLALLTIIIACQKEVDETHCEIQCEIPVGTYNCCGQYYKLASVNGIFSRHIHSFTVEREECSDTFFINHFLARGTKVLAITDGDSIMIPLQTLQYDYNGRGDIRNMSVSGIGAFDPDSCLFTFNYERKEEIGPSRNDGPGFYQSQIDECEPFEISHYEVRGNFTRILSVNQDTNQDLDFEFISKSAFFPDDTISYKNVKIERNICSILIPKQGIINQHTNHIDSINGNILITPDRFLFSMYRKNVITFVDDIHFNVMR